MRLAGDLRQQLRETFYDQHYSVVEAPRTILVEEKENDGAARVTFQLPHGARGIEWKIPSKIFGFLKKTTNADGAFFVERPGGGVDAYIVECKRTVNQDSWNKAKHQMFWTLLRLRALAGVLGVAIERVVCCTAFRDDELSPERSPDPAEIRLPIGEDVPHDPTDAEDQEVRRDQFDWERAEIDLRGLEGALPHHKIALQPDADDVGIGTFDLAVL